MSLPAADTRAAIEELNALPPGPPDMAQVGAIMQKYDINPAGPPPQH